MLNLINVISEPGVYQAIRDDNEYVINMDNDLIFYYRKGSICRPNICLLRDILFKKSEPQSFALIISPKVFKN